MTKKKILVVDDDQGSREALAKVLIKEGFEVIIAEGGMEAIQEMKRQKFDLIITDLRMPEIPGIDLVEKALEIQPGIAVIIITAFGEIRSYLQAMTLGVFEYLNKPVKLDELKRVIKRIFEGSLNSTSGKKQKVYDILSEKCKNNIKNQEVNMSMEELDTFKAVLSTIAHSLKGEFTNIGGSLGAIKELCKESSELGEECAVIERSVMYIQILLRRMLDYLNIGTPPIEEINISELFKKTEMLASARLPSNIKFLTSIDNNSSNQKVYGNTDQLMWVILELINNSVNALRNKHGTIKLKFRCINDKMFISVIDNGSGIPEDIKHDIFKKKLPRKSSTGVGLFLSSKVTNGLGGDLILKKSSEKGTIFSISMPTICEE